MVVFLFYVQILVAETLQNNCQPSTPAFEIQKKKRACLANKERL